MSCHGCCYGPLAETVFGNSYTSSDGQSRSEKGVKTRLGDAEFYEVTGTYGFQAPYGKFYFFEYSSGVDGFKAVVKGKHSLKKEILILSTSTAQNCQLLCKIFFF